jgi:hypothetical protein
VLFYGYVLLLIVAGAWGVLFGRVDQSLLLGLHLDRLPARVQADVMSQYRFLRAIELGFGLFALIHRIDFTATAALAFALGASGLGHRTSVTGEPGSGDLAHGDTRRVRIDSGVHRRGSGVVVVSVGSIQRVATVVGRVTRSTET